MGLPTEIFNPHRTPIENLEKIFVARDYLLKKVHESLCLDPEDHNTPHWLITGQRGIGKTHFLKVLFNKITTDDRTRNHWIALHQREEEYWRVHSTATFLRGIALLLKQQWVKHDEDSDVTKQLTSALDSLADLQSGEEMLNGSRALLERFHRNTGIRIAVGAENLDSLFQQFRDPRIEGRKMRDFLQHSKYLSLIGTSITTELGASLSDRGNPFYRFFRVEPLKRLTFDEQLLQLRKLAEADADQISRSRVHQFLTKRRESLIVLHHLSGGNPRLGVFLYGVLAGPEALVETIDLLHGLLDMNTPYFQDRMKDLAPRERPIAAAFCEAKSTLTGIEAAKIAGMDRNVVYSLLTRLERAGFIEPVEQHEPGTRKGKYFQVSEDLFRMWWQYRFDSERQVQRVVQFLAVVYAKKELGKLETDLRNLLTENENHKTLKEESIRQGLEYTIKAIEFQQTNNFPRLLEVIGPAVKPMDKSEARKTKIQKLAEAIKAPKASAEDLFELAKLQIEEGNPEEAEKHLERAVSIAPKDSRLWHLLGLAKVQLGHLSDAQSAIEKAIEIDPKVAWPWSILGLVKRDNGDLPGAQKAIEKAIEIDPKEAGFWSNLGLVKRNNGDLPGAQKAYEKAIEIDPKNARFWSNLAELKMDSKDHEGLRKVIDRLHTSEHLGLPIFATYFYLTKIGALELEDAISFFKEAKELKGSEIEWREFLSAVTEVMMSEVDIADEVAVEAQLKLVNEFAKIREQTRPLESLIFVFEYFLARLRPLFVRGGKKMTPKERGKRILAKVPREQRDAIRRLIRQVEKSGKKDR